MTAIGSAAGSEDPRVAAAMSGDAAALQTLWQEHRSWIAAVLLAHKPPFEELEDLLQEVAMTLVRKIGDLRESGNLRAWLRTVAVNAARASGRAGKNRPRLRLVDDESGGYAAAADGSLVLDGEARRVLDLAAQLPEAYGEPLLLRAVRGLRPAQIAQAMGLPETTVHTRIARARRMMREMAAGALDLDEKSGGSKSNGGGDS